MTQLEIEVHEGAELVRVELRGELDLATVPQLEEALEDVEAARPAAIALDLSGLAFLDSTGLRAIVAARTRSDEAGRRLVVVKGPDPVHRVFTITRLVERLEIVDDVSALAGSG